MTNSNFEPTHPTDADTFGVLFICMANFCRSPTAEAVFTAKARQAGLAQHLHIDSAGTHQYRIGSPPDPRSQAHAKLRGYDMSMLRARQIRLQDFEEFDLLLVMDLNNLAATHDAFELAKDLDPSLRRPQIRRLTEFCIKHQAPVVPDPFRGGDEGFAKVLDLIEDACEGLVRHLQGQVAPRG
jgi:protein-tyrosine phosphatase